MKPKQTLLTLVEARREFAELVKVFRTYADRTQHLGLAATLISHDGIVQAQDPEDPWAHTLLASANLMAMDGYTRADIEETFLSFVKKGLVPAGDPDEPLLPVHPLEQMRAIMVATIGKLMPVLRPMREFDAIVARAGSEDELKMQLVRAFNHALLDVLADGASQKARQ